MPPFIIEISFPKSSSTLYQRNLEHAKKAMEFITEGEGRATRHTARFTVDQFAVMNKLLSNVKRLRGVTVSVGGITVNPFYASLTAECYMQSLLANDHRAYCCHETYPIPKDSDIKLAILSPCRILAVTPNENHPSSFEDQFQAAAVRQGVWWCPNLRGS